MHVFFSFTELKHFYKQQYSKGKCKSICTFYRTAQQPRAGGRAAIFNHQQEQEICNMVIVNNSIRLREIQSAIINDNNVFANINSVSISTIDRVLKRLWSNATRCYLRGIVKEWSVKELRYQYIPVNYWCALSEFYCTSKMPVLLEVLETYKKRKPLLSSRIKITVTLFCFCVSS